MSALSPQSLFRQCDQAEIFHPLRSAFLDEFARLEIEVSRGLEKVGLGVDSRKVCFTQRLEKLANAVPSHLLSRPRAAKLPGLCRECEPLKELRAALVHGILEIGTRNDEPVAFFRNVADSVCDDPIYHVLSTADFQRAIGALKSIKSRFVDALNPSSPPPPKPAATAGP